MKNIIIVLSLFLLSACQTAPVKKVNVNALKSALFKGYVSVKDKKKSKNYVVNFKTKLLQYDLFRMDVTAPFLGHLASVSLIGNQAQFLIPAKKMYYSGLAPSGQLKKILPINLNSRVLYNVFWGTSIRQPNWSCHPQQGLPVVCKNASERIHVKWEREGGAPKKVYITHPDAELTFLVSEFVPNYQPVDINTVKIPNPKF